MANIFAMLNHLLVDELGLAPFRPDYAKVTIPNSLHATGPSRPAKILVVDDSPAELLKSALALIGIPNLTTGFFQYKGGEAWKKPVGEELLARLRDTAKAVLELDHDIILMDQGLGDIDGSALVTTIKTGAGDRNIIFVANTDGDPEELLRSGCLDNFEKGRNSKGILRAINQRA